MRSLLSNIDSTEAANAVLFPDGNTLPRKSNGELRMAYEIKRMHISVLVSLCVLTPAIEELRTGTFGKP